MMFTPAQQTALGHACYFAIETAHPRFARSNPLGSIVLTINTGYE